MVITLFIIGLILIIFIIGRINLFIQFSSQVKTLFAESKDISNKKFQKSQLASLPEPV